MPHCTLQTPICPPRPAHYYNHRGAALSFPPPAAVTSPASRTDFNPDLKLPRHGLCSRVAGGGLVVGKYELLAISILLLLWGRKGLTKPKSKKQMVKRWTIEPASHVHVHCPVSDVLRSRAVRAGLPAELNSPMIVTQRAVASSAALCGHTVTLVTPAGMECHTESHSIIRRHPATGGCKHSAANLPTIANQRKVSCKEIRSAV